MILLSSATSYKIAFPDYAAPQTQTEARTNESAIFNDASSKEDYYERCNDLIEKNNHIARPADDESPPKTTTSTHDIQEPSQTIGPFTNCTHHTTGLFSTIYKTHSTTSPPQPLALKLTTPSECQPPHDPNREARLLKAAAHTNIIPLLSTHTLHSHYLLVFPFHPLDLDSLLHQNSAPLSKPQVHTLIHDLFSALAHLHSLGLIHRDIKPSNILLASPHGPAYLSDFGIAWSPHDPASEPAGQKITDVGTTCYRAPELLFGNRAYDCTLDLWAAGCVVAELIHYSTATPLPTRSSCPLSSSSSTNAKEKEEPWTLFTAGALGSELALIKSHFETLGTPTHETWPEAASSLPDWNKMSFVMFPGKSWEEEILPVVGGEEWRGEREVVKGLIRFQSSERWSAERVLEWGG